MAAAAAARDVPGSAPARMEQTDDASKPLGRTGSFQPRARRLSLRPPLSKQSSERSSAAGPGGKYFFVDDAMLAYLERAQRELPLPKTVAEATVASLLSIMTQSTSGGKNRLTPSESYLWGRLVADDIAEENRDKHRSAVRAPAAQQGGRTSRKSVTLRTASAAVAATTRPARPKPSGQRGSRRNALALTLAEHGNRTTLDRQGLFVRDFLSAMHKSTHDRLVREAILFLAFISTFLLTIWLLYSVRDAYNTNAALENLYLDQEFAGSTYKKNFYEVATHQEMWQWLEGPFFEGTFPATHYNGEPLNATEEGYALNYLRVLGSIQIRQIRVRNDSCELSFAGPCDAVQGSPSAECVGPLDTLDRTCFGVYSEENEERRPFVGAHSGRVYEWSDGMSAIDMRLTRSGIMGEYGTGGYAVELPSWNRTEAESILADLKSDLWTDRATRLLAVHINFYNTNSRLLSALRIVFEIYPGSFFLTSVRMNTVPINLYDEVKDQFRVFLEILLLVYTVYCLGRLILHVSRLNKKKRYLWKLSTLLEIAFLGCVVTTAVHWLQFVAAPERQAFNVNETRYIEFYDMTRAYIETTTVAGVVGLLSTIRVFQFVSVSRRMNVLWLTLWRASGDLAWFSVVFFTLVAAFAFVGEMTYGFLISSFRTFFDAFGTLLRYPLGDFRYQDLLTAQPTPTIFFFPLYVAFVIFVGMNLIIAIISKFFVEVHVEVHEEDFWKKSTQSYLSDLHARVTRFLRWTRIRLTPATCGLRTTRKQFFDDGNQLFNGMRDPVPSEGVCDWTWIARALCLFEPTGDGGDFACDCNCRRRCQRRQPRAHGVQLNEAERTTEEEDVILEHGRWEAQHRFQESVARCMRSAEINHGRDLFTYVSTMFAESGRNALLFITGSELNSLISAPGTGQGAHSTAWWAPSALCAARRESSGGGVVSAEVEAMITAYHKMKEFVFDGEDHPNVQSEVLQNGMSCYEAHKVQPPWEPAQRLLHIDKRRGVLLECDAEDALVRRFPLTELVWMSVDSTDSQNDASLLFTSKNVSARERHLIGPDGLDTVLRLRFESSLKREEFLDELSEAQDGVMVVIQDRVRFIVEDVSKCVARTDETGMAFTPMTPAFGLSATSPSPVFPPRRVRVGMRPGAASAPLYGQDAREAARLGPHPWNGGAAAVTAAAAAAASAATAPGRSPETPATASEAGSMVGVVDLTGSDEEEYEYEGWNEEDEEEGHDVEAGRRGTVGLGGTNRAPERI